MDAVKVGDPITVLIWLVSLSVGSTIIALWASVIAPF
jgi:hypothetical protein